ncbi:MAG: valine--tRNA ligase [Planctomycetota bacterium]
MDLPKQYDPAAAYDRWSEAWAEAGTFDAVPDATGAKPPHAVMMPLPNVTGVLHLGHALNNTIQDVLTRWRRMQGYAALWQPGTDHAGIATQAVVERRMLEEEGLTRHDVGREALVNRIWAWKETSEARIVEQLKLLGASCDFRRQRFTLDEVCSKAVRETFFRLFKDGLIYRGKRLVNWDTYLQTAVADDEVYEEDVNGHFWTFEYPVVDADGTETGERLALSTTRPETMLGDTAVCVHPDDDRYKHLVGKTVRVPINGRVVPVIADGELADMEKGTGCVKVTPAHDPNDYACWERQRGTETEIDILNVMHPDGTMNAAGDVEEFIDLDRYKARDLLVEKVSELGLFKGVEDRVIPLKHSDRSKTPVEPYLSDQWFVRMGPAGTSPDGEKGDDFDLAGSAIDAVAEGRTEFFPPRYQQTYESWLGEKRDWCISRQLWWGHRIPVWRRRWTDDAVVTEEQIKTDTATFRTAGEEKQDTYEARFVEHPEGEGCSIFVCLRDDDAELLKALEADGFEQDPDVLDTWFSSALWPLETLGWPDLDRDPPKKNLKSGDEPPSPVTGTNADFDFYYPTAVLSTSRDIITLWVARMVVMGLYHADEVPFKHVYIHPKILDGFGQTMSKSKGNGVDPLDMVDRYGVDAVRFTMAGIAGDTQDVRLPVGYECPHCGEIIPQTLEHQKARPMGGEKPTIACPACGKESQFSSPWYTPDEGVPVARMVSERFEAGRNFGNKLFNAARFAIRNLEGYEPGPVDVTSLPLEDRWIVSRLAEVTASVTDSFEGYRFDDACRTLRDFVWNDFCDWYLELTKPRFRDDDACPEAQRVLVGVLDAIVRLLHPVMPFLTEELWHALAAVAPERGLPSPTAADETCAFAPWPAFPADWVAADDCARMERLQELIVAVRNVRATYKIAPSAPLNLSIACEESVAADITASAGTFEFLVKATLADVGPDVTRPPGSAGFTLPGVEGFVPLGDVIDVAAEKQRQEKEAKQLRGHIAGTEKRLANEKFVASAPPEVVQGAKDKLAELRQQLVSVEEILSDLG